MKRREIYQFLNDCFLAGLAAVDPQRAVAEHLDPGWFDRPPAVLAIGKAAPAMSRGVAEALGVDRLQGVVVSNHVDQIPDGLTLVVGDHPVPGSRSEVAGRRLLEEAQRLDDGDHAVVLISGGGSALAEVPIAGVSIEDIARANEVLLACGADIGQINTIRRHLSSLKGGGLAAALGSARLTTLVVSDVVGDSLEVIASGPTVVPVRGPEPLWVVDDLGVASRLPAPVLEALGTPRARYTGSEQDIHLVANGAIAAHAAAAAAEEKGYPATVVDTRLVGEASAAAGEALARSRGSVSVYAGETTVEVVGSGSGGRNHEAALTAAMILDGNPDAYFLAAGTDGIDGVTDAAGAIADGTTIRRGRSLGLDPAAMLDANDSGSFFAALGDQIRTGPTGTNVGDIWIVMHTA